MQCTHCMAINYLLVRVPDPQNVGDPQNAGLVRGLADNKIVM